MSSAEFNLEEILKEEEGLRLMPYKDTQGLLTIGYGRCLERVGIRRSEAECMFLNDLNEAKQFAAVVSKNFQSLSKARQGVLICMVYQMGLAKVMKFEKMRKAIEAGDFEKAAAEMLDSEWARQTPMRAARMAKYMREG